MWEECFFRKRFAGISSDAGIEAEHGCPGRNPCQCAQTSLRPLEVQGHH